jgi:metal-dependent amidase/aminoacylase/carboxypeptidase family protein
MASDVTVEIAVRHGYRDMVNNLALARRFGEHLRVLGRTARERDPRIGAGSTDMGDVSHALPAIHPWLAIVGENEALCHEHRFAQAAGTDGAGHTALLAAKALARTAVEFLADVDLRAAVRSEWEASRAR